MTPSDETEPLLNYHVQRQEQTSEVVVESSQPPIGQIRLFGSLLVDSIPGNYMLLLLQMKNWCSYSYSIIFVAKFDSSRYNSDSSETRPGGVVRGISGFDACFCNRRVPLNQYFLYLWMTWKFLRMVCRSWWNNSSRHTWLAGIHWRGSADGFIHSSPALHLDSLGPYDTCMRLLGICRTGSSRTWPANTTK